MALFRHDLLFALSIKFTLYSSNLADFSLNAIGKEVTKVDAAVDVEAAENFSDGNKVWHQIEMHLGTDCS